MPSLMLPPLLILLLLFALAPSAVSAQLYRTLYVRGSWVNFSVAPLRVSTQDRPVFVRDRDDDARGRRGGGVLYFTTSYLNGTLYGQALPAYPFRYNVTAPPPTPAPRSAVRLTQDAHGQVCPAMWYRPPPEAVQLTLPLQVAAENQTTRSDAFSLLTTSLFVDNADRLVLHGDAVQLAARFDVPVTLLNRHVVAQQGSALPTSAIAAPAFPMSLLWGRFCNGSGFWYPDVPYASNSSTPPPPDGGANAMSLADMLVTWNMRSPTITNDGTLLFLAGGFPCVFAAAPGSGYAVSWHAGNCTADADPFREVPNYAQLTDMPRNIDIGGVNEIYYDRVDDALYISSNYGVVLLYDHKGAAGKQIFLVLGNSSSDAFRDKPLVCFEESCGIFGQMFPNVGAMSAWREHGDAAASPTPAASTALPAAALLVQKLPSRITATHFFAYEVAFQTLYSVNLRTQRLYTEMTVSTSHDDNAGHNNGGIHDRSRDKLGNCRPRSLVSSDADLFVVCDDGDTILRRRLLRPDPLPQPSISLPQLDTITIQTVTALATFVALIAMPTVALTAGRTRSVIALVRCDITMERGVPLPWSESPTQLSVTPSDHPGSDFRYFAGCVVGNVALLVVAPLLVHYVIVRVVARRKYAALCAERERETHGSATLTEMLLDEKPLPTPERVQLDTEASLRFPSASFAFALLFTLEPTVRAAAFIVRWTHDVTLEPKERYAFAIGIGGLVATVVGFVVMTVFYVKHFVAVFHPYGADNTSGDDMDGDATGKPGARRRSARGKTSAKDIGSGESTCVSLVRRTYRWYKRNVAKPYGEWRDTTQWQQDRRWGGIIKPYAAVGRRGWLVSGEMLSVALLAMLVGIKSRDTCGTIVVLAFVVLLIYFIALIVLRPQASPFENLFLSLVAGFNVAAAVAAIVASHHPDDDVSHAGNSLAETLALAGAFLVGIDVFVDVVNRVFKLLKWMLDKCCPSPEDKKKQEEDGAGNSDFAAISAIQQDPFAAPTSAPMIVDQRTQARSSGGGNTSSSMGSRQGSSMVTVKTGTSGNSNATLTSSPQMGQYLTDGTPHNRAQFPALTPSARQASSEFDVIIPDARGVSADEAERRKRSEERDNALEAAFAAEAAKATYDDDATGYAVKDDDVFSDAAVDSAKNLNNAQYALDDDEDDTSGTGSAGSWSSSKKGGPDHERMKVSRNQELERKRRELKRNLDGAGVRDEEREEAPQHLSQSEFATL